jgi:hypothetical protein
MTRLYNYCVRCGEELDDHVAEAYMDHDEDVPTLCPTCVTEIFAGPFRGLVRFAREISDALEEAFTSSSDEADDGDFENGGEVVE